MAARRHRSPLIGRNDLRIGSSAWALNHLLCAVALTIAGAIGWQGRETGFDSWLLKPLAGWDAEHYMRLAREGYQSTTDFAFFPLLGWLLSPAAALGDGALLAWGLLLASIASLVGLVLVHASARRFVDEPTARLGTMLVALSPWSYTAVLIVTDWLFISAAAVALICIAEPARSWALSMSASVVAAVSRPPGISVALALLRRRPVPAVAGAVALGAVIVFMRLLSGEWLVTVRAQREGWSVAEHPPLWGIYDAVQRTVDREWFVASRLLALLVIGVGVRGLVRLWRATTAAPRDAVQAALVLVSIVIALPLISNAMISIGRFTVTAFPLMLGIAALLTTRSRRLQWAAVLVSAGLQLALATVVFSGLRAP